MAANSLVSLAAAVREALAKPQSLSPSSAEEQKARLDLIDLLPELNAALIGDIESLRELAWSVSMNSHFLASSLMVIVCARASRRSNKSMGTSKTRTR